MRHYREHHIDRQILLEIRNGLFDPRLVHVY